MADSASTTSRYRICDEDIRCVQVWRHREWERDCQLRTPESAVAHLASLGASGHEVLNLSVGLIESALRGLRIQAEQIARNIAVLEEARSNALSGG